MSESSQPDPRTIPAAASDEGLLIEHEKQLEKKPGEGAHYPPLPLGILFFLSGLILFAATYLNRYSGHFNPTVYDENLSPSRGKAAPAKIDPVVFGNQLYHSSGACITCHQPTGQGVAGVYPPLAGSEWAQGPEDRVIRIVLYGLKGPVTVKGNTYNTAVMPVFGAGGYNWSDERIAAVLTFVRQEWGNKASPITAEKVGQIRAQVGTRDSFTEAELLKVQ